MNRSLFDGLMDFEPRTTALKKDLAEDRTISGDGMTFHNGREMTAEDVKYPPDRVTNPETQSPGAGFVGAIEGHGAMASGEATSLSGVTVIDPDTVEIGLEPIVAQLRLQQGQAGIPGDGIPRRNSSK